jgi:hypothetical protein
LINLAKVLAQNTTLVELDIDNTDLPNEFFGFLVVNRTLK